MKHPPRGVPRHLPLSGDVEESLVLSSQLQPDPAAALSGPRSSDSAPRVLWPHPGPPRLCNISTVWIRTALPKSETHQSQQKTELLASVSQGPLFLRWSHLCNPPKAVSGITGGGRGNSFSVNFNSKRQYVSFKKKSHHFLSAGVGRSMSEYTYGGHGTTCGTWVSPPTAWVPSAFTH